MIHHKLLALASLPLLAACGNPQTVPDTVPDNATGSSPEPTEQVVEAAPELPAEIAALLDAEFADFDGLTYYAGNVDLNGDGADEWMAYVAGPGACGSGGCPLRVFQQTSDGIETKGQLSVVQLPVGVFETETGGWRDLAITIGGGGAEYAVAKVPFTDTAYVSNPTVAPAQPSSDEFATIIAFPEM